MHDMILPIAVFLVVYFFIATELLDKTIASLIGAAVMIGLGLVPYTAEQAAEQYHAPRTWPSNRPSHRIKRRWNT